MRIIGLYLSFIPFSIKKKTGMERETQHKKRKVPIMEKWAHWNHVPSCGG